MLGYHVWLSCVMVSLTSEVACCHVPDQETDGVYSYIPSCLVIMCGGYVEVLRALVTEHQCLAQGEFFNCIFKFILALVFKSRKLATCWKR